MGTDQGPGCETLIGFCGSTDQGPGTGEGPGCETVIGLGRFGTDQVRGAG